MAEAYDRVVALLKRAGMGSVLSSLERAVREEGTALEGGNPKRDAGRSARERAREFYGEEICKFLQAPPVEQIQPLQPDDVLSHRRKPTVWAIARRMLEAGVWGCQHGIHAPHGSCLACRCAEAGAYARQRALEGEGLPAPAPGTGERLGFQFDTAVGRQAFRVACEKVKGGCTSFAGREGRLQVVSLAGLTAAQRRRMAETVRDLAARHGGTEVDPWVS